MSAEQFPFGWRYDGPTDTYQHYSGLGISAFEVQRMNEEIAKRREEWLATEREQNKIAVKNFERLSLQYFGVKP